MSTPLQMWTQEEVNEEVRSVLFLSTDPSVDGCWDPTVTVFQEFGLEERPVMSGHSDPWSGSDLKRILV